MENRMDRSEQLPGENQLTTSSEEQQIIKRITRLTLLLGILIGISLVFLALVLYNTFLTPGGGSQLVTPVVVTLLLPLSLISFGTVFVIQWRLQILRGQYAALRSNTDKTFSLQLGILGINFIGIGCLILLIRWGNVSSTIVFPIIGIWFLGFIGIYLYLPFRNKRREAR